MELLKKPTTYRIGLMQTKLNRLLKQRTTKALEGTGINPPEWAMLGVLADTKKEGMRLRELADGLGVEASFVTTMAKSLQRRHLVRLVADEDDSRAKKICLTESGRTFLIKNETELRDALRPITRGIGMTKLATYFTVLSALIENAQNLD
jgi:DNA-binding MarR family transcriptional regulator